MTAPAGHRLLDHTSETVLSLVAPDFRLLPEEGARALRGLAARGEAAPEGSREVGDESSGGEGAEERSLAGSRREVAGRAGSRPSCHGCGSVPGAAAFPAPSCW